ncbi:MAG: heparinase II/III family protein [Clostridia bacterium]|nr:heparinase II/III family protein [Clostridia bacterium]
MKYDRIYKYMGKRLYSKRYNYKINNLGKQPFYAEVQFKSKDEIDCLLKAKVILEDKFVFLNKEIKLEKSFQWDMQVEKDALWRYYLNYFDYGITLLKAYIYSGDRSYLNKYINLINCWIDRTFPGQKITWDPYPISRRIVNWLVFISYIKEKNIEIDDRFFQQLTDSVINQSNFLLNNLEYDIRNNHLTSDAKALIWSGVILKETKNSTQWVKKGLDILTNRMREEIYNDGFQYENSTSYQMVTIQDYFEIYVLLKQNNIRIPEKLLNYLEKMFEALAYIMRPDRSVPLLNDSVYSYPMKASELMAIGAVVFNRGDFKKNCTSEDDLKYLFWMLGEDGVNKYKNLKEYDSPYDSIALENAGYFIMRSGWGKNDTYLVFDCGSIGPGHCPGHGHADALSFELFAFGTPLIVDPGVYSYHDKKYRYYFKSTRAHNTVTIDGQDQSELLASFRVGRIAKTELIEWRAEKTYDYVEGVHYGYKNILHKRSIEFKKPKSFTIIDEICGDGIHEVELIFNTSHLLKEVNIIDKKKCECIYENANIVLDFSFNDVLGDVAVEDSFISLEWNKLLPNKKIVYKVKGNLPLKVVTKLDLYKEMGSE